MHYVARVVTGIRNPALEAFVAEIQPELVLAQVLILRSGPGFSLRHASDRAHAAETLRHLSIPELRGLAQTTEDGAFRPLKSAPNLQRGWTAKLNNADDLGLALGYLYPGAIADRYAVRHGPAPATDYRPFTNRQTGMYRVTQLASDSQAAEVIRACCHVRFCLKQRLWTAAGLHPDQPEQKSLVPCLEPCAILLEFARSAIRIAQADKTQSESSSEDARILADGQDAQVREADFSNPRNPRRLQLTREQLQTSFAVNQL